MTSRLIIHPPSAPVRSLRYNGIGEEKAALKAAWKHGSGLEL